MIRIAIVVLMALAQATHTSAPPAKPSPIGKQATQSDSNVPKNPIVENQQTARPLITSNQYIVESSAEKSSQKDWWDKASVAFGGLLVVIGAAGGWFALRTLRAIEVQTTAAMRTADAAKASAETSVATLRLMQSTAESQLRAYVCFNSAVLRFPQPNAPEVIVELKNCGQTPAYDVQGWIHTWFAPYPLKEVMPVAPPDLRKGVETLAPERKTIFVTPPKPPLPPLQLSMLGTPKFTMYIYGEVTYKDVFGKERYTRYRLIHGGNEGIRKSVDKEGKEFWLLKPDSEGNETS